MGGRLEVFLGLVALCIFTFNIWMIIAGVESGRRKKDAYRLILEYPEITKDAKLFFLDNKISEEELSKMLKMAGELKSSE